MTVTPNGSQRRVRSAERVVAVLDLLRRSPQPLRHGDVAQQLAMPKSSTTNLLDTLVELGVVARDERGYALGVKLIELGATAASRLEITAVARPVLHELSQRGVGTTNLGILQGHDVLYVEKVNDPGHVVQIATRVGGTAPAHVTALGKVLVAALPTDARRRWIAEHDFRRVTARTITSAAAFERALAFAEEHGYALDEEEQNPHVSCVAAPVRDHSGATVAALSLTCLELDFRENRAVHVAAVVHAADHLSTLMGAP
jgi:DNA-binding IclR family transcriptional regulator